MGHGVVFKARQVSQPDVALKMIPSGRLANIPPFNVSTRKHSPRQLDHPNIVPIHEIGAYEGQHYFSMKFIKGGSLARGSAVAADMRRLKLVKVNQSLLMSAATPCGKSRISQAEVSRASITRTSAESFTETSSRETSCRFQR